MAQRTFCESAKTLNRKRYDIELTFFPAGASNPTYSALDTKGVSSIVRNGTAGEWLITLQDGYKRLVTKNGSIQMASATDLVLQFATIANLASTSAVTVIVRALAGATPTDIAANANNSISVQLCFSDADT